MEVLERVQNIMELCRENQDLAELLMEGALHRGWGGGID